MSKSKVILLLTILILPALAFLFFKIFGQNHFTLRTYFPLESEMPVEEGVPYDTVFHQVPDFTFVSQTGDSVSSADLRNNIYVADFFFASCLGICKDMSSQLMRVQDAFRNEADVKIVSFTVNPEHDSVEVLQEYAQRYSADSNKWKFLTGDRDEIYQLAQKGFYLPVQKVEGADDFIHSEKFMLVDKNQHVRGIYDGTDPEDVDRLITEIRVLLHEYDTGK